jgi:hypothetical protein
MQQRRKEIVMEISAQERPSPYTEHHSIAWNGIAIQIADAPTRFGGVISHLVVRSEEPNPITETGYCSHFVPCGEIESYGGALAFVEQWLEEASHSEEWRGYVSGKQQLSLF